MKKGRQLPSSASTKKVIRALKKSGAYFIRQDGTSHAIYKRPNPTGGEFTIVVKTDAKEIPLGTLRSILRQAGLSSSEFLGYYGLVAVITRVMVELIKRAAG